jgi:hypothetical protein
MWVYTHWLQVVLILPVYGSTNTILSAAVVFFMKNAHTCILCSFNTGC